MNILDTGVNFLKLFPDFPERTEYRPEHLEIIRTVKDAMPDCAREFPDKRQFTAYAYASECEEIIKNHVKKLRMACLHFDVIDIDDSVCKKLDEQTRKIIKKRKQRDLEEQTQLGDLCFMRNGFSLLSDIKQGLHLGGSVSFGAVCQMALNYYEDRTPRVFIWNKEGDPNSFWAFDPVVCYRLLAAKELSLCVTKSIMGSGPMFKDFQVPYVNMKDGRYLGMDWPYYHNFIRGSGLEAHKDELTVLE